MNYIDILHKVRIDSAVSKEELEALLTWVLSEEGKRSIEQDVLTDWNSFESSETYDYKSLLNILNQKIDRLPVQQSRPVSVRKYIRYTVEAAAVILLVIGISIFLPRVLKNSYRQYVESLQPEKVEIYNPKGLRTTITLPDNTKVTLNADSKITYLKEFLPDERTIHLEGEAFFEVAKDPERPFVVHANEANMTVLGTSFNVRSYPENKYIETTLIEGSLRVGTRSGEHLLQPGKQSRIDRNSQQSRVQEINTDEVIGWMEGKFYFQLTPFYEITTDLERAFNVKIQVENVALRNKVFTGKFENGENLEQILEVLKLSANFYSVYIKETNTIIINK